MRVQAQSGFVLHARDYSETSLLLEIFSVRHGRLGLLAKGARRPSSRLRGVLAPFQPLLLSWSGRGELPVLTAAETDGETPSLAGQSLYCGFYLNELLVRLLHRHDPHDALFDAYRDALAALAGATRAESALRLFEKRLLGEIGYGLVLDHDVQDNARIDAAGWYDYIPERGPIRLAHPEFDRSQGVVVRGASLLAFHEDKLTEPDGLRDVKRLTRAVLARYLGDKPLYSRQLFRSPATPANTAAVEVGE